ncbi:hypothetical protein V6N13_058915 [Hibiscus sabdariffa]|uniref:Uncharacterized protein n=1 Tax=Hibiscus sabdariffa TaxID=183260 RepID=A0ABR2GEP1_9ROSI
MVTQAVDHRRRGLRLWLRLRWRGQVCMGMGLLDRETGVWMDSTSSRLKIMVLERPRMPVWFIRVRILRGQDPKETERFGPWMIAASRQRRTPMRNASLDKSTLVAELLIPRGIPRLHWGSIRPAVVIPTVAGKGVQVVDHATEVSKGSHAAVKFLEPSIKGQGGQNGARSLVLKGRATKENLNRGLRVRRPGEMLTSLRPVLAELGQNLTGVISKGTLLEDTSFLDSVLHSSDAETMYELSDEDGRIDAEGVERPLVQ